MDSYAARFIGQHEIGTHTVRCGVVEIEDSGKSLLVQSMYTRNGKIGFLIERIANTTRAARDWLNY